MYILSPKQIAAADKATILSNEITSIDLMEYAATQCFYWLHNRLQGENIKIHVFCGIGNNGGDGLVIARYLYENGYNLTCYIVNFSEKRTKEFLVNYNRLKEIGIWPTIINNKNDFPKIAFEDIVIDAIFGNGLTRSPEGFTKELIIYINTTKAFKFGWISANVDTNSTKKVGSSPSTVAVPHGCSRFSSPCRRAPAPEIEVYGLPPPWGNEPGPETLKPVAERRAFGHHLLRHRTTRRRCDRQAGRAGFFSSP